MATASFLKMAENGSTDTPRRRQAKRPRLDFDQDDSSFRNTNHDPIPSTSTALTSAWQFGTLETNSFDFAGSGSLLLSATSHNLPRQQLPPPIKCGSCLRLLNSGASALPGTYIFCPRCFIPTCQICSRTCNSAPPSSSPPTPMLSYSPSPPCSPLLRPLGSSELQAPTPPSPSPGTRSLLLTVPSKAVRARQRDDDDLSSRGYSPGGAGLGGCGTRVCRKCCIEDPDGHVATCLDCYLFVDVNSPNRSDSTPSPSHTPTEFTFFSTFDSRFTVNSFA